jgi:filamentous hemagglutinin family protein
MFFIQKYFAVGGIFCLLFSVGHLGANPIGGQVAAGSATINTVPGTVTIHQVTNQAVINWQSFSIDSGELTKFIQPSSTSAVLNRVLGGQTSILNGTLSANGQVYLINGNGILVGPGGQVNTAGFIASTRDIQNTDFLSGNLHFTGSNANGVQNLGTINAIGGDIILIGKTVDNAGTLTAPDGHVGLAAADDILVTQSGMQHVFVRAVANPGSATAQTGVNNSGTIAAASAELRAANGNIYALATNNSGLIRATGVTKQGGHIWLIADQGITKNTGTLSARAKGGRGGAIETSGGQVQISGTIDAGKGGSWLIDPADVTIDNGSGAAPDVNVGTLETALNGGTNETVQTSGGTTDSGIIDLNAALSWTSTATLQLTASGNINLNQAVSTTNGTLSLSSGGTISDAAALSVGVFKLQAGSWVENSDTEAGHVLPTFAATNFQITSGASFLRVNGGSGTSGDPYQIADIYGLQGIGSSSAYLSADYFVSAATISASGTSGWNAGAGFVPISSFTGFFNGNGAVISGLDINLPTATNVALFGQVGTGGTVENLSLNGATVTGKIDVGALVGTNYGTVETSSAAGTVAGENAAASINIGGLVGLNDTTVTSSFATDAVTGYSNVGGLVGNSGGTVLSSYASGAINSFHAAGSAGNSLGGLVGTNSGTVSLSFALGSVTAGDSSNVGGLVGNSTGSGALIEQSYAKGMTIVGLDYVGGLLGADGSGQVIDCDTIDGTGIVSVTGTMRVGGLLGFNAGTVTQSYVLSTGSVLGKDNTTLAQTAQSIGGLVGENEGGGSTISSSYANITVGEATGTTDATQVGGLVGVNDLNTTITAAYASGHVTGSAQVGGLVGLNSGTMGVQSYASGAVVGTTNVGGLVGSNTGSIGTQSYALGSVTGVTDVGGLVGLNNVGAQTYNINYATGNVIGTTDVGGLIGWNEAGTVLKSYASGTVSDNNTSGLKLGGLIGENDGTVTTSYALGTVTGNATLSMDVGGLVGDNTGAVGTQSYASGNVSGHQNIGGLAGLNSGTVGDLLTDVEGLPIYTDATGTATGTLNVGGLIGDNSGAARQVNATGTVKGNAAASGVGGLIGTNEAAGTVTTSYSNSIVDGNGTAATNGSDTDAKIGGLIGNNVGAVSASYATGSVTGDNSTGGLIGLNNSAGLKVQTSYSTGAVAGIKQVGGLVGLNTSGIITQNYSTSAVTGTLDIGGLVGENAGTISENYSIGSVAGTTNIGGLVGSNDMAGTIGQSYATGAVTGTTAATVGGLVGDNVNTATGVTGSYWDGNTTGRGTAGIGNDPTNTGAMELTSTGGTPTAFNVGSYSGFGTATNVATGSSIAFQITDGAGNVAWYQLSGSTRPFLAWEGAVNDPELGNSYVIYTSHELQLMALNLGVNYVLGKSIDLSDVEQSGGLWNPSTGFVPVGDPAKPFTGDFSGAGYTLSNLFIHTTANDVGLFGASSGLITGASISSMTGLVTGSENGNFLNGVNITGGTDVGSVVGLNTGTVQAVSASGMVDGNASVGGLVGANDDHVLSSDANVAVTGVSSVGGLVGSNGTASSTVEDSYALGDVTGTTNLGGLAGTNDGLIETDYAVGTVTGASGSQNVGGLIGADIGGSIEQSYAVGAVNGTQDVGGLLGFNSDNSTVLQSYATGAATGTGNSTNVGGLVGENDGTSSVTKSYASGVASGATVTHLGGLIGANDAGGVFSNLFWDSSKSAFAIGTNTLAVSPAGTTDLHGSTINAATAAYAGFDTSGTPGFVTGAGGSALVYGSADGVWRIQTGSEFPLLTALSTQVSGTDYSDAAHTTPVGGATVTFNSGTNLLNTTVTSSAAGTTGDFNFLFSADVGLLNYLPNVGRTLRLSDSAHSSDSIAATLFNANGVPNLLADIAPADLWDKTVRVVSGGLNNTLLSQAGSSFITVPATNIFNGTDLLISENFDVGSVASSYTFNGNITAQGNVAFDAPGNVDPTYDHTVTIHAETSSSNPTPSATLNAVLSSQANNRAIVVESDGNFINNVGTGAFSTPNGTFTVYSQNPQGSGQTVVDDDDGLNELHLYGTNYMETPTYILAPNQSYQIYTFTPTLTLTAVATGADGTGNLAVTYGTPSPTLTYTVTGLLAGDTVTAGATFNQVISNQPGETTTYAKFSAVGNYPVSFIGSTEPTSLIGYNLVFASGNIQVNPNPSAVTINVSGSQNFGYIGAGPTFAFTDTGVLMSDPNFNPTFSTTVGQFASVNRNGGGAVSPYSGTISLNLGSVSNYSNVTITTVDNGFTVNPAPLAVSASGTSIYGDAIATPLITSSSPTGGGGTIYDNSGTGSTVSLASLGYTFSNPAVTSTTDVGAYTVPVSGPAAATSGVLGNYNVTINPGSYTITPRALTITTTQNETKVYDGSVSPTTFGTTDYTYSATSAGVGLINGDVLDGTMGRASPTDANVGAYAYNVGTLAVDSSGGASKANDYNVTFSNSANYGLDITPVAITISTTANTTKVYGAADPAFGSLYALTAGTLVAGESLSGSLSRVAGQTVSGSPYAYTRGTVGVSNSGGVDTSNYTVTFQSLNNLTITVAPLTITVGSGTKVYGATTPSFTGAGFTTSGLQYTDAVNSVTYGGPGVVANASVAGGPYTLTASAAVGSGGFNANNYSITYVSGSLTVTPKPLTITASNDTLTYNDTAFTGGNGVTYAGFITGENSSVLGGTLAYGGSSQNAVNAGTYAITPSGLTSTNYAITFANGTLTINKAPLTVTADNQSKVYGAADPTLTYTASGTLYGADTYGLITGVNLSTTTGALATAGTHTIAAAGGTAANYVITDVTGTLTVSKAAALTVTADAQSKVYGATDPTLTYTPTGTLFYGDTFGTAITGVALTTTTGAAATAGTHAITFTNGGVSANYNLIDVTNTLTVTPAPLTVTAGNASKTYNGLAYSGGNGVSYSAFAYGQNSSVLGGTVAYGGSSQGAINAGGYVIAPSGLTSSNYAISYVNGALNVGQAALTIAASADTLTYNATAFSGGNGVTYTGFANGEGSGVLGGALTYSGSSQGAINAGIYVITPGGLTSGNYAITFTNGALTINKAALTVTADNQGKIYGAADPALTYTPTGTLYGADTYGVITGVNLATTTGAAATAGTHVITASGGIATNYTITDVNGTLTVGQATLAVTADDQSKVYGATDPTLTYTPSGTLYYGDSYSVISGVGLSTTTGAAATAGTHVITATGGTASNYVVADVNGALTVTPASLTVTADNQSKVYGAPDPTLTYTPSGTLYYGDGYGVISGVSLSTATGAAATGGTHTITASGGIASNYNVTDVDGTLTVTPASLVVTANGATKTYDGLAYSGGNGVSYSAFAYGQDNSALGGALTYAGSSQGAVNAGTYAITPGGLTSGNYAITYASGALNVGQATLTIAANADTVTYNANAFSGGNGVTYTGLVNGEGAGVLGGALTYSGSSQGAINAGTYVITPGGVTSGNYAISFTNGALAINQAALTVTATNQSKVYGATDPTLTYTPTGTLYGADTYGVITGVTLSTTTGANATAGAHTITANGGTAENYSITDVNGTLNVSQAAALTVTADNQSKVYGATDPTLTYTASGTLYYGDTYGVISGVSLSTTTGAAATAGTHAITASGGAASNYAVADANGTLTVSPAALVLTPTNVTKIAGQTYTFSGTEFTVGGQLYYGDTVTSVVLTSAGTGAAANAGAFPIAITPGSQMGTGLANYAFTYETGTLTVGGAIIGHFFNPGSTGAALSEFTAIRYDDSYLLPFAYPGDLADRLYHLEVPGATRRVLPENLTGIEVGSSRVRTRFGMEDFYDGNRFTPLVP